MPLCESSAENTISQQPLRNLFSVPKALLLLMVVLLVLITLGQIGAFPNYDDSLIALASREAGSRALFDMHFDQPVNGWLWWKLDALGVLWSFGVGSNIIWWALMALLARAFVLIASQGADTSFWRDVGYSAPLVVLTPIFLETNSVIITTGFPIIGVSTLILSTLLIFELTHSQSTARYVLALILCAAMVFGLQLFYFYGVPSGAVVCAWVLGRTLLAHFSSKRRKLSIGRSFAFILTILVATGAGYACFKLLGDFSWRASVSADSVGASLFGRLVRLPLQALSVLLSVGIGAFAEELGAISVRTKLDLIATVLGALSGFYLWRCFQMRGVAAPRESGAESNGPRSQNVLNVFILLAFCIFAVFVPVRMMGRPFVYEGFMSRMVAPALPFMAIFLSISLRLILCGLNSTRFLAIVGGLLISICARDVLQDRHVRDVHRRWGNELQRLMESHDDQVVALFPKSSQIRRTQFGDDLLTARLTMDWPPALRKRFWASVSPGEMGPNGTSQIRIQDFPSMQRRQPDTIWIVHLNKEVLHVSETHQLESLSKIESSQFDVRARSH